MPAERQAAVAAPAAEVETNRPPAKRQESTRRKRQPPYAVVLHNDDVTTMPFVVNVLRKVFGYDRSRAIELMLRTHESGRALVWTGTREVAELKAEQVQSCGPDPQAGREVGPLRVSVEPMPAD